VARVNVDDEVARMCTRFLELADRRVPGLVDGLYLHGSVALGDYRPGVSDVDVVVVTSRPADVAAVRDVHTAMRRRWRRPYFDALYVTAGDLRRDPARSPAGPVVHEHRVHAASRAERHLVTWQVLAQSGLAIRGPRTADLAVFTDWAGLQAMTRDNLAGYWTRWCDSTARGTAGLSPSAVSWGVLGVARLRHTLAAGRVTSKTEAAAYASGMYDARWRRVVQEALRVRCGGPRLYRDPWRRRSDLVGVLQEMLHH
jgi:hypothetical protein